MPDLMLGCGLGYAAIFVLQALAGPDLRAALPLGLAPLVALVSGTPHYGATLLRVYERREDRRAYALFTVWASLVIAALFLVALRSPWLGSCLLTVYLTWSPWHYTGQNYGIALLFLQRRGVPVAPGTKRAIYLSFLLSFVLTLLAVHSGTSASAYAPTGSMSGTYRFLPLGIPSAVAAPAFVVVALLYLAAILFSARRLLRVATLRTLAPSAILVATQALWFSVPVLVRRYGALQGVEPLSIQYASYAFLWVAVGHSIQYLWITTYFAERSHPERSRVSQLTRSLLAGSAIWTLPALVFAPGALGRAPYDAGLYLLIASAVNIHHFVLDGAIWKLRDGRVARILVRSPAPGPAPAAARSPGPGWRVSGLVWAAGAACVLVTATATLLAEYGLRQALARGDLERATLVAERLRWLGRDSPTVRAMLGLERAEAGEWEAALRDAERGLALYATAEGWQALGAIYEQAGRPQRAIEAYRMALELRPGWPVAVNNLAWIHATAGDPRLRNPGVAVALAEAAARATGHSNAAVLDTLAAAYAAQGRISEARSTIARAHRVARAAGDVALVLEIEERQRLYVLGRPYVDRKQADYAAAP